MPDSFSLEEIKKRHWEITSPTVRIRAKKAWGSGTVVYSQKDKSGKFRSYVLTCHHVVSDSIKVVSEWDQRVGMQVKKEKKSPVEVQFFYYENYSLCKGLSGSYRANIMCYDEQQDIALLEIERFEKGIDFVGSVIPEEDIKNIHVHDPVYACGAALGHPPITTKGIINYMNEIVDDYDYWMSCAPTIFGNSGGAVFRYSNERDRFEFIGIPAMIAVKITGFSQDAITHMGYFVPISRIYKFLRKNFYDFLYDEKKTYEGCEKARKKYQAEAKRLFMAKFGGSPKSEESLVKEVEDKD